MDYRRPRVSSHDHKSINSFVRLWPNILTYFEVCGGDIYAISEDEHVVQILLHEIENLNGGRDGWNFKSIYDRVREIPEGDYDPNDYVWEVYINRKELEALARHLGKEIYTIH